MRPLTREQSGVSDSRKGMLVNEVFYSLQGEGVLTGTPMVFIRFAKCNLRCSRINSSFDCDTDFTTGQDMTVDEICDEASRQGTVGGWVLFTGGEPGLQLDTATVRAFKSRGFRLAVETNGTVKLPEGLDHICVSPKSAAHTIQQHEATELKIVRRRGQELPDFPISAPYKLVSPAFDVDGQCSREDLEWCIRLVKDNPSWRLSIQTHKLLGIR